MATDDVEKAREIEAAALRLSQAQEKASRAYDLLIDLAFEKGLPDEVTAEALHAAGHASIAAKTAVAELKKLRAGGGDGQG
jgi:hypothetical protein